MKLLMISCKKATYLISKKEENKLSWLEKIRLRMHLTVCSICRRFEIQTAWITSQAKHIHTNTQLSPESKEKMQDALDQQ